jgi:hypothetical protein
VLASVNLLTFTEIDRTFPTACAAIPFDSLPTEIALSVAPAAVSEAAPFDSPTLDSSAAQVLSVDSHGHARLSGFESVGVPEAVQINSPTALGSPVGEPLSVDSQAGLPSSGFACVGASEAVQIEAPTALGTAAPPPLDVDSHSSDFKSVAVSERVPFDSPTALDSPTRASLNVDPPAVVPPSDSTSAALP